MAIERPNGTQKWIAELLTADLDTLTKNGTNTKTYQLSKVLFKQIDVMGTHSQILVLEQPEIPDWNPALTLKGLTVATPLGDPSNLGALIRSADAFGIENLILLQESANPFLPKSVKASAGSVLRMNFHRGPSVKDFSQAKISDLIGLDMKGISLKDFQWPESGILLLGEEGLGLPKASLMKVIQIPTKNVESLNATVAASIALYDFYSKNHKKFKDRE